MNKYAILIQKLVKLSDLKPDQLEVDKADPTRINLLVKNSGTGEMIPFAQYEIEKSFIDFLSSGEANGWNVPGINGLVEYLKAGSFQLATDPENYKSMDAAEANETAAKNLKTEQIPEYLRVKKYIIPLKLEFRRRVLNKSPHDTALRLFTNWLKRPGPSGSPSPAY